MPKIKRPDKPLYELAKEQLMELIDHYQVGARLPSEEVLSREMGISRNTLREATKVMVQKGWLEQRQGSGTYVIKKPQLIDSGLETLESFDTTASRNGWSYGIEQVEIKRKTVDEEMHQLLNLPLDSITTEVSRVIVAHEKRIAFMTDIIPVDVLSEGEIRKRFKGSVLNLLEKDRRFSIDYAYTEIIPTHADKALAGLLGIGAKSDLMLTREMVYATDGKLLEYGLNYMVAEFFSYHVIRRPAG